MTNQGTFTSVVATTGSPSSTTAKPTFSPGNNASQPFQFYTSATQTSTQTFPYLIDKFFYSAQDHVPNPPILPLPMPLPPPAPLPPIPAGTANNVDDPTSAGWFKMFEFFEVPSQSMGAYGPVAQGANFDWFRQDVKPGLINLNMIIDEEVFLSVLGRQNATYFADPSKFHGDPHPPQGRDEHQYIDRFAKLQYDHGPGLHRYAGQRE